jgi:hypothetical protein
MVRLQREELRSVTEQLTLETSRSAYGSSDCGPPDGVTDSILEIAFGLSGWTSQNILVNV